MALQISKRAKELKRDIEAALLDNNAKVAGGAATARELAGVGAWIATNESVGATGVAPTGDGSNIRTDGTQRAISEAFFTDVLQQCYTAGGEPDVIMVGPFNRAQVSTAFTGGATKFDKTYAWVH